MTIQILPARGMRRATMQTMLRHGGELPRQRRTSDIAESGTPIVVARKPRPTVADRTYLVDCIGGRLKVTPYHDWKRRAGRSTTTSATSAPKATAPRRLGVTVYGRIAAGAYSQRDELRIDRGAFHTALSDGRTIDLYVNHTGAAIASTSDKSLVLREDQAGGIMFRAYPANTPTGREAVETLDYGGFGGVSFGANDIEARGSHVRSIDMVELSLVDRPYYDRTCCLVFEGHRTDWLAWK